MDSDEHVVSAVGRGADDLPVWSLSCFYLRKGYRKQGVTSALIVAALKAAKRAKAPALEACHTGGQAEHTAEDLA
jgi:GNAT superfamily N-acetyltransferase